jgi:hypothetical protein
MSNYFKRIPDVEYPKLSSDGKISEFEKIKNIFKRGTIREDIFENLVFFEKYDIIGDERPDSVANKIYNNPDLDWIVLLANNITNVYEEWPMPARSFDRYLNDKYGSFENIYAIKHFETEEVKNSSGVVIVKEGLIVPESFFISYYDKNLDEQIFKGNITKPVTNYEYEVRLDEKKRTIFLLKGRYLQLVFDDLETVMTYKKGSTQYVSRTLKRADNTRITMD